MKGRLQLLGNCYLIKKMNMKQFNNNNSKNTIHTFFLQKMHKLTHLKKNLEDINEQE